MADAFDLLGDAVTTDKGSITDYSASFSEVVGASAQQAFDTLPTAYVARALRTFNEEWDARFGGATDQLVDRKTAEEEVRRRNLDLKIPAGGISRYSLDMLQYLKQREISQNVTFAQPHSALASVAGFGAGVATGLVDPLNVASSFIPFVSEARYGQWLARAGESTLSRAAVRVGAGALEGAGGAAVLEPINYAGATSDQRDYSLMDSFLNVTMGAAMGAALHPAGGAIYDYRVSQALRGLDVGIQGNDLLRTMAANAPEHVQQSALHAAVSALETDGLVDVEAAFANQGAAREGGIEAWHGSPHVFDQFHTAKIGTGEGAQAYGHGLYFAERESVSRSYLKLAQDTVTAGDQKLDASGLHFGSKKGLIATAIKKAKGDLEGALAHLEAKRPDMTLPFEQAELEEAIASLRDHPERYGFKPATPTLYKVRLNVKPEELLDWDKKFAEQSPEVRAILEREFPGIKGESGSLSYGPGSGGSIYKDITGGRYDGEGDPVAASEKLRAAGIKGIRYLDGFSRNIAAIENALRQARERLSNETNQEERLNWEKYIADREEELANERAKHGDPTQNFVIFDHNDVEIISRNGEPIGQKTPRDLGGLIEQSKADRTQAAFDRQFGDVGAAKELGAKPTISDDPIERAKADEAAAVEMVDQYRQEGRVTAEDEAVLKAADDIVKRGELRAKAFEAAAACMVAG